MLKKILLALLALSASALTACAENPIPDTPAPDTSIAEMTAVAETAPVARRMAEMNSFIKDKTTAKCTESDNAADFSSLLIEAKAGDVIAFEGVDFTEAKVLMLEAAIPEGSTDKRIELYIDEVSENNKIGTLSTSADPKVGDLDFREMYAELDRKVEGTHTLFFGFSEDVALEADWFALTSYTGTETEEERDARMQWWREAKFGQFIHFGAYSYLGGEYLGEQAGWYSEWIMNSLKISKEDYAKNATANFNPTDFDAKKIVADAKATGQKYLVITSRHHEGLSIYDTKIRNFKDYSLTNKTACPLYSGGDILKELAEECRAEGLHFGVYTTIMDWHDPSQTSRGGKISVGCTKEEYKAQLKG